MTAMSNDWTGRIAIDPDVCNGKPTLRGKRIAVQTIIEFLAAGDSPEDVLQQYPSLEMADVRACLAEAAQMMQRSFEVRQIA